MDWIHQDSRWGPPVAIDTYHVELHRSHHSPRSRRFPLPVQPARPPCPWSSRPDNLVARRFRCQRRLRTIHLQETAGDEEGLWLLETLTPVDNGIIVLRRDHPHDHGFRQLGFGEFFDDSCYPLASLDEHVDPLVFIGSMSIALGMVTANSDCR